jgi:hypothetical protein
MSTDEETVSMARRALLTEHERDALLDRESNDARYVAVSRVRKKIDEELTRDVEVLRHHDEEHDTDLLGKLREVVCEDVEDEDIAESGSSEGAFDDFEPVDAEETNAVEAESEFGSEGDQDDVVDDETEERIRDALAGSGDLLDARLNEILKMYEHLREHGEAEKDDLLDVVDVGATDYASRDSVWSNMVKGKDTLRALPGVEKPSTGRSKWKYTGETDE